MNPTRTRIPHWLAVAAPSALTILVIIVVWAIGSRFAAGNGLLLPSPLSVFVALFTDADLIVPALGVTLVNALWGMLWGIGIGAVAAIIAGSILPIRVLLTRQLTLIFCLPLASIAPLVFLIAAPPGPQIILAAIATVFPVYIALLQGIVARHTQWEDLSAVLGGGKVRYFLRVQIPAMTGQILTAARFAIPAAVLGVTLAEYFGGTAGIGVLMINSMAQLDAPRAYALGLVITLVCSASYIITAVIERLFPWIREAQHVDSDE